MFRTALFMQVKNKLKWPSVGEQLTKMCHLHPTEYSPAATAATKRPDTCATMMGLKYTAGAPQSVPDSKIPGTNQVRGQLTQIQWLRSMVTLQADLTQFSSSSVYD